MSLKRWKLTIEYDGTAYNGWQCQDNLPTIQGKIEEAIEKFCQQKIRIQGAGRTDSGVHALGQIAHFDLDYGDRAISGFELTKAINAHLIHETISIVHAEEVSSDFHARFQAKKKLYVYKILARSAKPSFDKHRLWHVKYNIDVKRMKKAAQYLIGTHDFSSFRASECQAKDPVRTLDNITVTQEAYDRFGGQLITLSFRGPSFLHHQVRNMAGTLKKIGEGRWDVGRIQKILKAKDRKEAGPTAPPQGLTLVEIEY